MGPNKQTARGKRLGKANKQTKKDKITVESSSLFLFKKNKQSTLVASPNVTIYYLKH